MRSGAGTVRAYERLRGQTGCKPRTPRPTGTTAPTRTTEQPRTSARERGIAMRRLTTYRPTSFPTPVRRRLVQALAAAHEDEPFGPDDVRAVAHRVVTLVERVGLAPVIVRGGVDVGGAELDHVFVVVEDRVVDVALPVRAAPFAEVVRAWVAGDVERDELWGRAADYGLEDRVVGEFPAGVRYRGAPLWGTAA